MNNYGMRPVHPGAVLMEEHLVVEFVHAEDCTVNKKTPPKPERHAPGQKPPTTVQSKHECVTSELQEVAAAQAGRAVMQEQLAVDFIEGTTVLDYSTAYRLLDNPPEPTEALRALLHLR